MSSSGMNMGKIGDFVFYIKQNEYKKISKNLSISFGSLKPVKGQERLTDAGGFDRKISLNGVLVVQPKDALKSLEDIAEKREVIRFTTLDIDMDVVITSLNITQEHFLDDGSYTVQSYNLSLKEVYDEIL